MGFSRRCSGRSVLIDEFQSAAAVGSVSHGPDQPRTAPSSPPQRLHFPPNCQQLSAALLRLPAGQQLHFLSDTLHAETTKLTGSPDPNFTPGSFSFFQVRHFLIFDEERRKKSGGEVSAHSSTARYVRRVTSARRPGSELHPERLMLQEEEMR